MRILAGGLAIALIVLAAPSMGDSLQNETIDSISGTNLRAIQAAMPEASKMMADLDEYVIRIGRQDGMVTVTFADRESVTANLTVGGGGRIPEFTVELTEGELQFIRLYHTR